MIKPVRIMSVEEIKDMIKVEPIIQSLPESNYYEIEKIKKRMERESRIAKKKAWCKMKRR